MTSSGLSHTSLICSTNCCIFFMQCREWLTNGQMMLGYGSPAGYNGPKGGFNFVDLVTLIELGRNVMVG